MAWTHSISVKRLKVKDQVNSEGATLTNAVVQTYWEDTLTHSDGRTGTFHGATPFSAENVPAGSFVAFEDLEEATVVGWIENIVNNDATYKAHIEEMTAKTIEQDAEEEIMDNSLPWAPEPSAEPSEPPV